MEPGRVGAPGSKPGAEDLVLDPEQVNQGDPDLLHRFKDPLLHLNMGLKAPPLEFGDQEAQGEDHLRGVVLLSDLDNLGTQRLDVGLLLHNVPPDVLHQDGIAVAGTVDNSEGGLVELEPSRQLVVQL